MNDQQLMENVNEQGYANLRNVITFYITLYEYFHATLQNILIDKKVHCLRCFIPLCIDFINDYPRIYKTLAEVVSNYKY